MPSPTKSVREIVSSQPSATAVLQRFKIDLCSQADESLQKACSDLQLSIEQVLEKLSDAAADDHGIVPSDIASYSLNRLIQYIVRTHHQYIRRELPGLVQLANKVGSKYGDRVPELKKLESLVDALRDKLLSHLQKEEEVLFPFLAQLDEDVQVHGLATDIDFSAIAGLISQMVREHEVAMNLLVQIRVLTNDFEPPAWACPTHTALYAGLRSFEDNFTQHLGLENDHLFPRSIESGASLSSRG